MPEFIILQLWPQNSPDSIAQYSMYGY